MDHVRSSRKCFSTGLTGFSAAWPRPQIEASLMTCVSSLQQRLVPVRRRHQLDRLLGADAAGRALAAALVLEEAHQVERHRLHVVLVGEDDDRGRADEAAIGFERAEIERDVGHRRRQDAARGAARQIALEDDGRRPCRRRYSSISSRAVIPAGASLTPGSRTRPETEKVRRPLRPLRPWPVNQSGPFSTMSRTQKRVSTLLISVGRPNSPTCDGKGRLVARQPALALDALEHRRFLAADIGAGAAPQVDARVRRQARRLDRGDLAFEDRAALRVLVAQVDVDLGRLDHPGGDQHAFEEAVRVGFEKIAVLEGAGLALVGVDRHQPRRRLLPHQAPFAPGRKPGAAEPAQPGMLERSRSARRACARRRGRLAAGDSRRRRDRRRGR